MDRANVNIYIQLTKEFNEGRLRAIICSGQAVVLHRLAIMSKDGDWILREEESALRVTKDFCASSVLKISIGYKMRDLVDNTQGSIKYAIIIVSQIL